MKIKRFFIFIFFVGVFLLSGCNLSMVTPTPMTSPTFTAPATSTITQSVLPPTSTKVPFPTLIITPPTPTLTLFYNPTATQTPSWMECPLVITRNKTDSGDVLHIRQCEENLEYDLGPFAKGVYAAGPGNKFITYVSDNGMVYVSKMGEQYINVLINLTKERFFTVINKKAQPRFVISFTGTSPYYKLLLIEKKYNQKRIYDLPNRLFE